MDPNPAQSAPPDPWHVVRRLQSFQGEERANVVRIVAIAVFYCIELVNRHGLNLGFVELQQVEGVDDRFHAGITSLAAAWVLASVGVLILMRNQRFPPALKYVITSIDVFLLSAMLTIADGPGSPLVVLYFLILAGSPLRFSLRMVWFTTAAVVLGYLMVVGEVWLRRPELRVPRYEQIMMVSALVLVGMALAELSKSVQRAAQSFAARSHSGDKS